MSRPLSTEDLQHVLDHTRELWEELRGRRIFVTGGTGFFGCWLLESFAFANDQLKLDAKLTALTRDPDAFRSKAPHLAGHAAIELWPGDVRDFKFPEGEFFHVIHAAATSSAPVAPIEMLDTITGGARRVLDFAVACSTKKFLLASSGAIYGRQPPELTHIPETYAGSPDPADPDSAYGEGKRISELLGAIYHRNHGIELKIARCFAFAGPHLPLDAHFAIGNFIRDALAGGPIHVKGDGTPFRSYLYAADLAIWLWTILLRGEVCLPYNVGSEEGKSLAEIAETVAVAANLPDRSVIIHQTPVPGAPCSRYVCGCERAQKLNLESRIPLPEQIRRIIAWHKAGNVDISAAKL